MAEYVITTAVGTGEKGFAGDGGPAQAALLNGPFDVTFAGTGAPEHGGDDGHAAEARIFGARAVKLGPDGTIYILERQGSSLRAVDRATGIITTIAGTTGRGYSGDGGPALAAVFDAPKE